MIQLDIIGGRYWMEERRESSRRLCQYVASCSLQLTYDISERSQGSTLVTHYCSALSMMHQVIVLDKTSASLQHLTSSCHISSTLNC